MAHRKPCGCLIDIKYIITNTGIRTRAESLEKCEEHSKKKKKGKKKWFTMKNK